MAAKKKTSAKKEETKEIKSVVKIENNGPCNKKVCIEVPEEMIQKKLDEQYKDITKEAMIPGFRKGRAPMRLVVKRFGEDVRKQVKLQLLAETSDDALKDNDIDPIRDPDIDYQNIELPETGPMTFEFEVEVRPEFELPKLEGIEIEKSKVEIDEKQIDQTIDDMRRRAGMWVPKEGNIKEGDQIIADVVAKVEGQPEDIKQDNTELFVRKQGFAAGVPIEDMDKLLAGAKAGDTKTTTVNVPETYFRQELRGKKVDVTIDIREIKELKPAEMNEEFFRRYGVEDEDELRDAIREMRENQAEQEARTAMGDQVYQYLLKNTAFDLPGNIVVEQSTQILQRRFTRMLMQGYSREKIDEQMEELRASSDQQAAEQLKLFFIMDKIAGELGIEVTEEEINGHIAQAAAQRGRRPEKLREELARDGSLDQFRLQVREQKVIEKLLEDAEIKGEGEGGRKKTKKKTARKDDEAQESDSSQNEAEASEEDSKAQTREETAKKRVKKKTAKKDTE